MIPDFTTKSPLYMCCECDQCIECNDDNHDLYTTPQILSLAHLHANTYSIKIRTCLEQIEGTVECINSVWSHITGENSRVFPDEVQPGVFYGNYQWLLTDMVSKM